MATKNTTLQVADGNIVYIDGVAHHPGQMITVPHKDADALLTAGTATTVKDAA